MRASKATLGKAKALRRTMTLPEVLLWRDLRRNNLSVRFRRQRPIGPYVLDFYCTTHRLAVEVDGAAHDHPQQTAKDTARDA